MNDHAERLRHMAKNWLRAAEDQENYRTRAERINSGKYYRAQVAALLAGAEALERLGAMESASSAMLPKSASGSEAQ